LTSASTDAPLTFCVSRRLRVPAEAVWREMARPGHLADCHPFCARNVPERWPGVGARDSVHYHNGRLHHRNFTAWQEGRSYTVVVTDPFERRVLEAEFSVAPAPDRPSESVMRVAGRGLPGRRLPGPLRRLVWRFGERALMERYFDHVIRGFEHHLLTGQRVRRNQFGWVPGFS